MNKYVFYGYHLVTRRLFMSKNDNYKRGQKICSDLFMKTGDIRYHNMMNGFKELEKENKNQQENQPGM